MSSVKRHDEIQGDILHEYDGIEEADNALPFWWLLTFYGAIVFAVFYWFYYHEFDIGQHQPEVFAMQMAERASQGGTADEETLLVLAQDPTIVATGEETFTSTCSACHGQAGEGQIGPNLTDDRWLHGGAPEQIYASVKEGWTDRGMPAWGPTLGEGPVQAVTAYVLSIRDTNLPGKAAEGDVYDPNAAAEEPAEEAEDAAEAPETGEEPPGDEAVDDDAAAAEAEAEAAEAEAELAATERAEG